MGVRSVARGRWRPESGAASWVGPGGIGLLVLEGLLIRRVGVDDRFGAELLGEGDLLRPWQGEDGAGTINPTTGWRVLEATRLAVLDEHAARVMAAYPQLTGALVARAVGTQPEPGGQHGDHPPGPGQRPPAHAALAPGRPLGPRAL